AMPPASERTRAMPPAGAPPLPPAYGPGRSRPPRRSGGYQDWEPERKSRWPIVAAVGAIANRGVWIKPHIVKKIVAQDGRALYEPKIETRQVVSERTAQMMVRIMERVVTHGTARHAINLAGYSVAGKTGTPQKVENKRMSQTKYMPSFAGFVPAADPRLAIVVMIDEPQGSHQGGSVAAPVFNLIAEAALGDYVIPPDDKTFRDSLVALSKEYEAEESKDCGPQNADCGFNGSRNPVSVAASGDQNGLILNPKSLIGNGRNQEGFVMPDFRGRGVRAVTQACAQMNLVISLHGSGVAFRQSPAAGTRVRAGETCKVEFQ
ncbi:MAG TPA: penicillin-binding transpeptidase domain-containing protein, partial [Blastocatellia bacterium]